MHGETNIKKYRIIKLGANWVALDKNPVRQVVTAVFTSQPAALRYATRQSYE
jgi:hypothetical protein